MQMGHKTCSIFFQKANEQVRDCVGEVEAQKVSAEKIEQKDKNQVWRTSFRLN